MINLLVEVSPVDANGSVVVLRLASQNATKAGLQFGDGYRWLPLISKQPARDISWSSDGELQETSVSWEPVVFNMAAAFGNDDWPNLYNFQGAPCRMWRGNMGDPFSSYTKIYEGTAGAVSRKGLSGELPLLGTDFSLDRNVLTRTYAGTDPAGGMEGQATLRGALKPFAAGVCLNVEPIKVDPINLIWQYHAYGPTKAVDAVYEDALTLGPPAAIVGSFADLKAAAIKEGEWATAPAIGAFRLGSQPRGKITADVRGALATDGSFPTTVGGVMKLVIIRAGQSAASVAASLANRTETWPLYLTEQTTAAEELRKALLGCGCASVPTANGQFAALDYYDLKAPLTLDASQSNDPIIRSYSQLAVAPPVYRVIVSGERNWSVHSEQEVSEAIGTNSAELEAVQQAAADALAEAKQAQADADVQKKRIDDLLADGLLTRDEKAQQIARYDSESAQFNELFSRASTFEVAAERSVLGTAWDALSGYLNSLSPSFRNLDESTPIDGRYDSNWREYELAKIILLRAMSGSAATTAAWGGVAGRPTTLAQLDADAGTKLDQTKTAADEAQKAADAAKAAAEAAKAGSQTVAANFTAARLTQILKSPLDDISAVTLEYGAQSLTTSKDLFDRNERSVRNLQSLILTDDGSIRIEKISELGSTIAASVAGEATARDVQIKSMQKAYQDADALIAQDVATLGSRVTREVGGLKTTTEAAIRDIKQSVIDGDYAQALRSDELSASLTGLVAPDGLITNLQAAVQRIDQAEVDNNGARAQETTALKSRLDNFNGASLEQQFTTVADKVAGVSAQYVLRVQTEVNGVKKVAGMGLASDNNVSAIVFDADALQINVPGAGTVPVFTADATGVYMPNVRVDKLTPGAIDFEFLAKQSIRNPTGGYQVFPGGFIMQWGQYRGFINTEQAVYITFPMAFPNQLQAIQATAYINVASRADRDLWMQTTANRSNAGAEFMAQATTSNRSIDGFDWVAFGY